MDVISEVLKAVQLRGAMFFNACFSAPWSVVSPASNMVTRDLAPGAQHLIIYHLVTEGHARASVGDDEPATVAAAGEIIIFPHGDPHTLANGTRCESIDAAEALPTILARHMKSMTYGGGGEITRFVCGYMACDPIMTRPILGCLPPVVKINIRDDPAGQWIENSIRYAVTETESSRAGSEVVLAKLSEVLFVEALRRFIATLPAEQTGWLAGARDAIVGQALALLHQRPAHAWSIAELANHVGASRSSLAERFTHYLNEPPMAYLTRWRMQLAARLLTSSSRGVIQIAAEVGYESEAAFNRAFKRHFGVPPARYRSTAKLLERNGDQLRREAETTRERGKKHAMRAA